MQQILLYGLGIWLLTRLRKKDDEVTDNTTPDVVPFTAENVRRYKTENTRSLYDRRLASAARRVTPDGTGKAIVDGSYKCFAPGSADRIAAIRKVYQDLDRLRVRIANSTGERREEARKDLREKDDERAILVGEHYMICEKWFEDFAKKSQTPTQTTVTTTTTAPAQRGV